MEWLDGLPPTLVEILKLGLIVLLGLLAGLAVHLAGRSIERRVLSGITSRDRVHRLRTLVQAGTSVIDVIIAGIVLLMILYELEINIAPILASAGVAGLALSLGSQTFIRDFFGGVLVLVENLFTVGDVIQVGDNRGKVERITLRATYLRNLEGEVIVVPNGDIRTFRNLTTDWSRAVVTLNVPRDSDMDQVMRALDSAVQAARSEEMAASYLLEIPQVEGWIDLTDVAIQVRIMAKTVPGKQWEVAPVLRKHALRALAEKNLPAEPAGE
jgi:small conductance mechanosensitive channel